MTDSPIFLGSPGVRLKGMIPASGDRCSNSVVDLFLHLDGNITLEGSTILVKTERTAKLRGWGTTWDGTNLVFEVQGSANEIYVPKELLEKANRKGTK